MKVRVASNFAKLSQTNRQNNLERAAGHERPIRDSWKPARFIKGTNKSKIHLKKYVPSPLKCVSKDLRWRFSC